MRFFVGNLDLFVYDECRVMYVYAHVMYMLVMSVCVISHQIVMHVMSLS
jgi:hypothetical protein